VPHIAHIARGYAPSLSQPARLRRNSAGVMAAAIALASVAVCARADTANPNAGQAAGVAEICQTVIRLEPGGAQYEACVLSLADSLRSLGHDHATQRAQVALQSTGGTPASSRSYFYASEREVYRREQVSCIRLGFDPMDGAFATCVANLDGRLFEANNPAQ
jgi:hypothetical protein